MTKEQKKVPLRRIRSRHKNFDVSELLELADKIGQWDKERSEQAMSEALSQMGDVYLERIKENTPIRDQEYKPPSSRTLEDGGKGFMRDSWELTSVIPLKNRRYQVTVKNDARFAKAVEYGHDQTVGRDVKQIKHHLTSPHVEGIHTIARTKTELDESKEMERILKAKFLKELGKVFNGK